MSKSSALKVISKESPETDFKDGDDGGESGIVAININVADNGYVAVFVYENMEEELMVYTEVEELIKEIKECL